MYRPSIWVLNRKDRIEKYQSKRLEEEAVQLGLNLVHVVAEDFEIIEPAPFSDKIVYNGTLQTLPDAVLTRQTGMTYFSHSLLRHFERRGVFVANTSEAIENAEDKWKSMQLLAAYEVPTPKTILLKPFHDSTFVEEEIGFPLVLKTVQGTKGEGVFLFHHEEQFEEQVRLIQKLTENTAQLIVQEYIAESRGTDLRVFVVGEHAIGCVQRTASDPHKQFKANVALGGRAEYRTVDHEIASIAVESAKALGLDIAGVDLLLDTDGYKVCEVNSAPSFEGFETDAAVNVPQAILQHLLREL